MKSFFGSTTRSAPRFHSGTGRPAPTRPQPCQLRRELFQPREILLEGRISPRTILQAGEIGPQLSRCDFRQLVNHPVPLPLTLHQAARFKIGEMLGDFNLRRAKHRLEMTHTERPLRQHVQQPQSRHIAQAFINFDQFHSGIHMPSQEYPSSPNHAAM
jgi:hypothetical protein